MNNQKIILIIDDEEDIREMLVDFFSEKGYGTAAAENGQQALGIIKEKIPDLVVTDLLLPGEHGIDIIKIINEEYFIPVIVISGIYKADEVAGIIKDYCVAGFFEKPLDVTGLLKKVTAILNA